MRFIVAVKLFIGNVDVGSFVLCHVKIYIYILCFTKERTLLSVLFTITFKLIGCSYHGHEVCWKLNYPY